MITHFDVIVVGSGGAGLSAALTASVKGARVLIVEKSPLLGGTTAMSGGGTWIPCHPHQNAIGVQDSPGSALDYLRACAPEGWHNVEDPLWVSFVRSAPEMITFLEEHSPLKFGPSREPDPYAEAPGGMTFGRALSPRPLPARLLGKFRPKLRGPQYVPWLNYEEVLDTPIATQPIRYGIRFAPRMFWRAIGDRRVMGNALVIGLLRGCLDHDCEIWTETSAETLIYDSGRVTGITALRGHEILTIKAEKGVVLASGGFEWNSQMMAEYFPGIPVEWTASPSTNTGDSHRMAAAVGARLDRMDQALVYGTVPKPYENRVRGVPASEYGLPHAMVVSRHGTRFMNEKQKFDPSPFLERDSQGNPKNLPAWRIYDSQFVKKYRYMLPSNHGDAKLVKKNSLKDLASVIGIDGEALEQTAKRFSDFAKLGVDHDYGRGSSVWDRVRVSDPRQKPNPALGSIERPPFYAYPLRPSFIGTKGGPRTNAKGQVVDHDWEPIAGLYAAGNTMANPFGTKGMGGGTTIGPVLTWGFIAGKNVIQGI